MTAFKKIIPCLDTVDGRVVKGIKFTDIKDVADPAECAAEYCRQGADELVVLDITATNEGRKTMLETVRRTAAACSVPLTVGGGIATVDDMARLFDAGVQKVSVNSAAVKDPDLLARAAARFGSERLVLAVDVSKAGDGYHVLVSGGKKDTGIDAVAWTKQAVALGAGAVLVTSLDADGMKGGYDLDITEQLCAAVPVPVIASGGCGSLEHFLEVFQKTHAAAALAASLFHYGTLTVSGVKQYLKERGIPVRL